LHFLIVLELLLISGDATARQAISLLQLECLRH